MVSEFWVISENNGGGDHEFKDYLYWSFRQTPDGYIIETRASTHSDRQERDRLTFDKKGRLKSYQYIAWSQTYKKTVIGHIKGDQWITAYRSGDSATDLDGAGWEGAKLWTKSDPYEEQVGLGLPIQCAPLVAAYHIRRGSLGYRLPWVRNTSGRFKVKGDAEIEAVGAERVEHAGEQLEAHVLRIAAGKPGTDIHDQENRYAVQGSATFLPDGSPINMSIKSGDYKEMSQRATKQEVVGAFKIDPDAAPDLPALPE